MTMSAGYARKPVTGVRMRQHGIHHVTAIAGRARRNLNFYTGTLGLRLVKKTVNFDDPRTYHFYYGDEAGHPGSILTFFPWEYAAAGRAGIGETLEIAFRVPEASIGYWIHRFVERGVRHEVRLKRFGESVIPFADPDGTRLALVAVRGIEAEGTWSGNEVPSDHAIRGIHSVTLLLKEAAATAAILTGVLGFAEAGRDGSLIRYRAGGTSVGGIVDLREAGEFLAGRFGAGSVHHIAFRASDDAAQAAMVEQLAANHGIRTTEQKDRKYFRSVYFREPGGVLFEIATDDPGFTVDEPLESLGGALQLPPRMETRRNEIESVLPPVT
jgi:glyoxalase family protein